MTEKTIRRRLTREEVINAIERRGCPGVPAYMHKFWGVGLEEKYGQALRELSDRYPDDICDVFYMEPGYAVSPNSNPEYRFGFKDYSEDAERHSIGETVVLLDDWDNLDEFLAHFPDPWEPGNFDPVMEAVKKADGRYKLGCFWRLFHERFWFIRGMENLMYDYYDAMDELKLLGKRLVEFYKVIIDRFADAGFDGIFTSDDLGTQHSSMMSPAIFEELYLPLYKEVIEYTHKKGMHFWLHSCGNNTPLMEMLIEAGVDVFHPVQKGCMDAKETMDCFGDRITFLAGIDVQHLIPRGTPQEIRDEIRRMKKTFNPEGKGMLIGMGNGVLTDTPLENIEAALDAIFEE